MAEQEARAGGHLWAWVGALALAIASSSTAPWWWGSLTGGDDAPTGSAGSSQTAGADTGPAEAGPADTGAGDTGPVDTGPTDTGTEPPDDSECWVDTTPVTRLFESPEPTATSVGLDEGRYTVLEAQDVDWAGATDRWYRIDAEGDEGWVLDFAVADRGDAC